MASDEREKYLCIQFGRYRQADRAGRSQLLNEVKVVTRRKHQHVPTLYQRAGVSACVQCSDM